MCVFLINDRYLYFAHKIEYLAENIYFHNTAQKPKIMMLKPQKTLVIHVIYFYLVLIGHLFNGYEQERMMYGGIFIHFLFYLFILNKKKDYEFK